MLLVAPRLIGAPRRAPSDALVKSQHLCRRHAQWHDDLDRHVGPLDPAFGTATMTVILALSFVDAKSRREEAMAEIGGLVRWTRPDTDLE